MPRYVSPGRTPSPSRSPSRTSRGRSYTDGVYTPTSSRSPSPSRRSRSRRSTAGPSRGRRRSPSSDYYYSDSYDSERSRSRSRSRSTAARSKQSTKQRLTSALDTSNSTGKEKAENVLKTSLVMLGAIGAASLAAHKLWPKGITYGDKDDWETEHEKKEHDKKDKLKGKLRDGRDKLEGGSTEPDPDRKRYIEERYRNRPRLPASLNGEDGEEFWEKRDRVARPRYYADPRDDGDRDYAALPPAPTRRRIEQGPPPPPTGYADPGDNESDFVTRRRTIPAAAVAAAPLAERDDVTNRAEPARSEAARSRAGAPSESGSARSRGGGEGGVPLPPPAPAPPREFADNAPLVVPSGASRASSSGRDGSGNRAPRYYVDKETIVLPSAGERTYVIQRDAPPGQRLRPRDVDRSDDRGYYR